MRSPRPSSHSLPVVLSLVYTLTLSLFSPFAVRRAEAAPAAKPAPEPAAAKEEKKGGRREGELLVRFRKGVSEQEKTRLAEGKGMKRGKRLRGRSGLEKLTLKQGQDLDALLSDLRRSPQIELAEPNYLVTRDEVVPDDPSFAEQWALRNTGATGGQPGADVQAVPAWETTTGAQTTVIAVIDSGIDFTHPDLRNNQWTNTAESIDGSDSDNNGLVDDLNGWDWVAGAGAVVDENGHGTLIAGIIAAEGNNGAGTSGVMWRAGLMSLRVLDNTGTGEVADAVEAIDYAVGHGALVINCSWGTDQESIALRDAIQRAGARGVVVVSSAGNGGRDIESAPYYPSSFGLSNQISVASTDNFDRLASWSNYGATHVTVAAPGVDILTTKAGGGYTTVTGTSASAAVVTGIAGLVKTKRWWLSAPGTRAAVLDGARRVAELTGKVSAGGVASASGALGSLQGSETEPSPTPTPSPGGEGAGETTEPGDDSAGPNMPDLNAERDRVPAAPAPPSQIHADELPPLDGDPCGSGGCGGEIAGDPDFSTARLQPQNETGKPGVTLGSRNFNWGIPLVSLPGRSGLDLNISLNYNSLVWTKQNYSIKFDADRGQPTAGFRIGFPTIQQRFYNALAYAYAYVLVTPSGGRVELRQVGTSNTYESADGSYMQMTDNGAAGAVVRTSDGTVLTFVPSVNNELRCTQIKDRNGNFITVTYNASGRVATVKDTLSRVITFNYDAANYLTSISQTWGGATYDWARFYYGSLTIQTSFSGVSVVGPQNGTSIGVLNQVWLPDGSRYYFDYTSWGQVWRIRRNSGDDVQLSYTRYNLPGSPLLATSAQTDCPRFTQRRDSAVNWTGVNALPAETVTKYSVDPNGAWAEVTTPNNVIYKEYYGTSGWDAGLTVGTEVWVCDTAACDTKRKVKWTTTEWTQDDLTAYYPINPRPTAMTIEDENGNKRRTRISYYPASSFNLPSDVTEYGFNPTTGAEEQLRKTHTDYAPNLSTTYVSSTRRIIGLVSMRTVYDGTNVLASKVEYQYDEGGAFFDTTEGTPSQQHDSAAFGTTFIAGRGNLTSVRRWDVGFPTDATKVVESNTGYNAAGSVTLSRDANLHATTIKYADNFSVAAKNSLDTLAYPKTVSDGDGFVSTAQYEYDTGAVSKTTSPTSGTGTTLTYADVDYTYDTVGRLSKVTNLTNGAYTRWVYPTSNLLIQQYQTISGTAEAYSARVLDGAGRVRGVASDHTFSGTTTSTYSGQYFVYDIMGRFWKRSNPTEFIPDATTGAWTAAGDDATLGFKYTVQTYDWNNRPLVTTNTDATTRTNSYGGCGCAGGETVTTTDERGRKKVYSKDVLGRLAKVEELNYDGSVYSTTSYTYDALDQLTEINQAGQLRTFEYDGHGRLSKRTTPEQGETNYLYNKDDTVQKVTDARGVATTFGYNARHLPTAVTYTLPTGGGGVAATPNVTLGYDAAGNRTSMTEKTGTVVVGSSTYHYDSLARMDWEERFFQGVGTYRLSYEYNLAGELTKLTGPSQFGSVEVGYGYDKVGRTTAVTGSGYATTASYVTGIGYRAFGAAKQISYGNTKTLSMTYDARLRLTKWDVPGATGWTYLYSTPSMPEKTGRVSFANNLYDATLDRSYDYDQVGRMYASHSGNEANGHAGYTAWPAAGTVLTGSYSSNYTYDQVGNMTWRNGWGVPNAQYAYNPQYANNRMTVNPVTGAAMSYDLAGNLTSDGEQSFTYNAQGQQAYASGTNMTQAYDGDGLRVKKTENTVTTLYLRSSVLGGRVVMEIGGTSPNVGQMMRGYVYLGGQMLAVQEGDQTNGAVLWVHQDPVTKSQRLTNKDGQVVSTIDLDPWGGETGRSDLLSAQHRRYTTYERDSNGGDEAMFRRYESKLPRFSQPDPYDGSYDLSDPQSFNRYSYTQNDPVNFVDPEGKLAFAIAGIFVLGSALFGGIVGAIRAPSGQRMRGFTIGFAAGGGGAIASLFGMALGGPYGPAVGGFLGGSTQSLIASYLDKWTLTSEDLQAAAINGGIGAGFSHLGSLAFKRLNPSSHQYKLIYPAGSSYRYWENLRNLWKPRDMIPGLEFPAGQPLPPGVLPFWNRPNVVNTVAGELGGNTVGGIASELVGPPLVQQWLDRGLTGSRGGANDLMMRGQAGRQMDSLMDYGFGIRELCIITIYSNGRVTQEGGMCPTN